VGLSVVAVLRENMVLEVDFGVIRVKLLARIVVASVLPNAKSVIMENIVLKPGRPQHAQIVRRARLRTARVGSLRVIVVSVEQENTLQKARDFALIAMLESGQTPQESLLVRDAKTARQTPILCLEATKYRGASATSARLVRVGAHAQIVWQGSTRRRPATPSAPIVQPASSRQQWRQHPIHVATVRQARSREQTVPLLARIATTEIFKMSQDKPHARRAVPESLQAMTTIPEPQAHIASLVSSNRTEEKLIASHAFLARFRRP
jgi:hypothetical protein